MFELFEKERRTYRRREIEPLVEISPGGRIRFNQRATEEILNGYDKVALGYNPQGHEIAIIKASAIPEGKEAILFEPKVIAKGKKKSIAAKAFFNKKQIVLPETFETKPELREDPVFGTVIVLSLARGIQEMVEAEKQAAATSEKESGNKKAK